MVKKIDEPKDEGGGGGGEFDASPKKERGKYIIAAVIGLVLLVAIFS